MKCRTCQRDNPICGFSTKRGQETNWCLDCRREYHRRWERNASGRKGRFDAEWYQANYLKRKTTRAIAVLLRSSKQNAKAKGLEHTITEADIIIPTHCPILGIPLIPGAPNRHPNLPSIDRINSSLGYVRGNVWVISRLANSKKYNRSLQQFIEELQNEQ